MKKLLLLFGLSLLILNSNAQVLEPITIDEKGHYTQQNVRLDVKTIKEIVRPNIVAFQEVKRGKSRRTWGYVLAGFSGAMVGSVIVNGENVGAVVGAAAGVFVCSVILTYSGSKSIKRGVDTYNSSLSFNSSPNSGSLKLGLTNHGVGLTFTF